MATAPGGLINTGIVPNSPIGTELAAITRRAFIPNLIVQIYQATPVLNMLMRGAQNAKGGVGQVVVPVQGNSFVSAEWIDFGGSFTQPADTTAIQDAQQNLTVLAVPISFSGMEALIQSSEVVIPRLKAKMADIRNVAVQTLSTALYTFNTQATVMSGLAQAYDDGTGGSSVYANIDRNVTANAFWKGQISTSAGGILSRSAQMTKLVQTMNGAGGEAADLMIMNPSDWTTLMQDFLTLEQWNTMPGIQYGKDSTVNSGFRALKLLDTNIVADLYCPKGTIYMINTKYFALYISEDAKFAFSGFYSAIPNLQVANVGLMICGLQTICVKPVSGRKITGVTGGAF